MQLTLEMKTSGEEGSLFYLSRGNHSAEEVELFCCLFGKFFAYIISEWWINQQQSQQ